MPHQIDRLVFLIHPLVWAANAHRPDFLASHREYVEYENRIKARWWRAIAAMSGKPTEALIIGSPGCPAELENYATEQLGDRALILKEVIVQQPDLWEEMLSGPTKIGLGRDLLAMFWRYGFSWESDELVHPVICRGWADRIGRHFHEHGMAFDPTTVRAEGWGESFEGCASNYTRYLGSYLGLQHPTELLFEMTVPDFRTLLRSRPTGRVLLERAVYLYLWEGEDGRQIARFHKALANVGDPMLCVRFPTGTMHIEVRNYAELIWPKRDSEAVWDEGLLTVPIWGGRAFRSVGGNHFIFARGIASDEFRDVMAGVEFVESEQ